MNNLKQLKFSNKVKWYRKPLLLLKRKNLRNLLGHLKLHNDIEHIEETRNSLILLSKDGFETQIGKKTLWYNNKKLESQFTSHFSVGKAVYLQDCSIGPLIGNSQVAIGSFCSFGGNVKIKLYGTRGKEEFTSYPIKLIDKKYTLIQEKEASKLDYFVNIGNDVFFGENVIILSNTNISDGVIVGMNSLVPSGKTLEPYGIYVGSPVRLVGYRFSQNIIAELLKLQWWNYKKEEIIKMNLHTINFKDEAKSLKVLEKLNNKWSEF